jgi:phosphoribosylamine--glycine ligase
MLTAKGPRVLEYNVRFGDPETQAILVRLASPLVEIFQAICRGNLRHFVVKWTAESSACVVLASEGYPGRYEKGHRIEGLEKLALVEKVQVFHAGTKTSAGGDYYTDGGRVLGITATGVSLEAALSRAYGAIEKISWPGMQYRRDIGRFRAASA